ncbi:MAG: DUF1446 domain-containing protein, partial [Planctomycetaceae bacterium]|nr:DUF1446 domain-containing protein [Planctomycetaceae bacterium]
IGRDARAKAQSSGEIIFARIKEAGFTLRNCIVECFSGQDVTGPGDIEQCVLRVAASSYSRDALVRFSKELMPLITAGPPGTTGYASGRPVVHQVFRYWPCLIDRDAVEPKVEFITSAALAPGATGSASAKQRPPALPLSAAAEPVASTFSPVISRGRRCLGDIAFARSGDKGTSANVGVIARSTADYGFLNNWLTAPRVDAYFRPLGVTAVTRYELPNLEALNFILHGILRDSLQTDAQGKALGQRLLQMPLE